VRNIVCTQAVETRLLSPAPEPHPLFHKNASPESVDYFRLLFAHTGLMFPSPQSQKLVAVQCKGCHENIPAPVESMAAKPIAAKCPLCHEHRRYLQSEVFLGPLSHRTADGRVG
jgi:hypothetical protein